MFRTTLLAATALSTMALGPAWADGGDAKRLTGLFEFGYEYSDVEHDNGFGYNTNSFHGQGSALWTLPSKLNLQGNFAFNTDRYDYDGGEYGTVDSWKAGVAGFWRDPTLGAVGGDLYYQSSSAFGSYGDGVDVAARGEFYLPNATLGGRFGYQKFTGNHTNSGVDGWYLGAEGKYYVTPAISLEAATTFSWNDLEPSAAGDADSFALDGEVEFLVPDLSGMSVFLGVGYEEWDYNIYSDSDGWRGGLGLRIHLGTDGSLIERNRSEPLEVTRMRVNF